jgi:hypothetical protein
MLVSWVSGCEIFGKVGGSGEVIFKVDFVVFLFSIFFNFALISRYLCDFGFGSKVYLERKGYT